MLKKKGLVKLLRGKGGFSLIELMVVVTIMGVLAAVAVPRFMGVLEQAKERADESNIHTLKTAAQVYFFEKGDWPAAGELNDDYTGDFRLYLDSFPSDPWRRDNKYYVMGSNGEVESLRPPENPVDPDPEDPENGNEGGGGTGT